MVSRKAESNWKVLLLVTSVAIVYGICRDGISVLLPFMQNEFSLSRAQIGFYSTFLYAGSTSVAVFSGRIVDVLGTRRSIVLGLALMGAFVTLYSIASLFIMFLLTALLAGFGMSMIAPSTAKAVTETFSHKRGSCMGVVQAGIGLGTFLAALIFPVLVLLVGWRGTVVSAGLLALLVAAVIYFFLGEASQRKKEGKKGGPYRAPDSFGTALVNLRANRTFVLLCLLGSMFGVVFSFTNNHFPVMAYSDYGLDGGEAGFVFGVLHVGGIFGRLGWGYVSDRVFGGSRRASVFVIGLGISLIGIIFGNLSNINNMFLFYFITFVLGVTALGFFGLYATAIGETVGHNNVGTGMGVSLVFVRGGSIISPPVFGYIADRTGSYSNSWFLLSFAVLLVSTIVFIFYRESPIKRANNWGK